MTSKFKKTLNGKLSFGRVFRSGLLIAILLYIIAMISAHSFADNIIFQPQKSFYRDDDSIIKLATENGEKISAKYFPNENAEYTILFSHGNAEDIGTASFFLEDLRNAGFSVFAYDYRGYGTSEGKPSEENSYADADAAYGYLTGEMKIPAEKIIFHGRSLGAAISIDLASRRKCGGLIAESAFVSAFRVMTKYPVFPFDKFENLKKIKRVKCPTLFIHGKKDALIHFWHGEKLFAEANDPKFAYWIENADHNNVYLTDRKTYLEKIRNFATVLAK
jgi:hypothetical protein